MAKKKSKEPPLIPCPKCGKGVLIVSTYSNRYYDRYCIWKGKEVVLDIKENHTKENEHELTCTTCGVVEEIRNMRKVLKRLTQYSKELGTDKLFDKEPDCPELALVERPKHDSTKQPS